MSKIQTWSNIVESASPSEADSFLVFKIGWIFLADKTSFIGMSHFQLRDGL